MMTVRSLPERRIVRGIVLALALLGPAREAAAQPLAATDVREIKGQARELELLSGTKAVLVGGAHVVSLTAGGKTEVRIEAGAKVDFLRAIGRSAVTAEAGATVSQVESADDAKVVLSGTLNTGLVDAADNADIVVSKGTAVAHLSASGRARVTFREGAAASQVTAAGQAAVVVDDSPRVGSVDASDNATVVLNRGARVAWLSASGGAEVTLNGGAAAERINASGGSRIHVAGGSLGRLSLSGGSRADIRRALFEKILVSTPALSVSGGIVAFTPGTVIELHAGDVAFANGQVTGAWADGGKFSFWLIEESVGDSGSSREPRRAKAPPEELVVRPFPGARAGIGVVKAPVDAEGEASLQPSPFKRYPFAPSLLESGDEELCRLALDDAQERFFSAATETTELPLVDSGAGHFRWLVWESVGPQGSDERPAPGSWRLLELDLDGTGDNQALLQYDVPHSWRGDNHYAFIFPSRKAAEDALRARPSGDRRNSGSDMTLDGGTMYHPEATVLPDDAWKFLSSEWAPSSVFEFKGRYFVFGDDTGGRANDGQSLGVFRLRADGTVERRCRIRVQPAEKMRKALWAAPGVASYLKVLRNIGRAGGADCGTLHAGATHDRGAEMAVERAACRPWAASRRFDGIFATYYVYSGTTQAFMNDWSFGDLWSRREYETYLEHVPAAVKGLERYYRQTFGMGEKDAASWATRIFEEVTAAWLLVPKDYEPGARNAIVNMILAESSDAVREWLAAAPDGVAPQHLHAAAESPEVTRRILDAGVPVDVGNEFGKTPLMTAAHMNRPDVVRLLLERKADPAKKTQPVDHCEWNIDRTERTALMYAAENAGPEVIRLLLDAGADPGARDSEGNGMSFYLQRNPWLTPEQRRLDIRAAAASASREPKGPSFDCRKAATPVERLICGDEVLRMQDRALAAAFARWLKLGGGKEARPEQRAWLKGRDRECLEMSGPDRVPCLQRKTRTRIRYLHNRIAEFEAGAPPGD